MNIAPSNVRILLRFQHTIAIGIGQYVAKDAASNRSIHCLVHISGNECLTTGPFSPFLIDTVANDAGDAFAGCWVAIEVTRVDRFIEGHTHGGVAANAKITQRSGIQLVQLVRHRIEHRTQLSVCVR